MGREYEQLTLEERHALFRLPAAGTAVGAIAARLGRHRATIYREIGPQSESRWQLACPRLRNASPGSGGYGAQCLSAAASSATWCATSLRWGGVAQSPIAAELRRRAAQPQDQPRVHRPLDLPARAGGASASSAPSARAKRTPGTAAAQRPARAGDPEPHADPLAPRQSQRRTEFGHWEADLMHFRRQRDALLTLQERTTRITLGARLARKQAAPTMGQIVAKLAVLPKRARRSATFDNGGEWAPSTSACAPSSACVPISAIRTAPGSAAASRTPTACYAVTCPGTPPCPAIVDADLDTRSGRSTPRRANASPFIPPWRPSPATRCRA